MPMLSHELIPWSFGDISLERQQENGYAHSPVSLLFLLCCLKPETLLALFMSQAAGGEMVICILALHLNAMNYWRL